MTGTFDIPPGYWAWCTACGCFHQENPCSCDPRKMRSFPDQEAAKAAYALGGDPALHAMEQALFTRLRLKAQRERERKARLKFGGLRGKVTR